ncbi:reverse transcriptase domain-containing protein [Tanacetum coccineum]
MGLVEAIDSLVPFDEHFATFRGTDIQEKDKKKAKNKQNRARSGKDQVKSKIDQLPPEDTRSIVVPEIEAANFEIKHGLLTLVQNKQFFGLDKEDPHAHIRGSPKKIWLEKEPPRSIQTWDDLVAKFINQFFPPSKTTNLRNEITNFKQRFDDRVSEAGIDSNDLLRAYSLNSPQVVSTSTSTSGVSPDVAELKDMVRALLLDNQTSPVPAPAP